MSWIMVTQAKDIIQIIRDILVIIATSWALFSAPPIVNEKKEVAKNEAIASREQLYSSRLSSLQRLNADIIQIDDELKKTVWKDSIAWQKLKAIRDLKEREVLRLEKTLDQ